MKKGTKVEHKEYGLGIIVEDTEKSCYDGEVMVKFNDKLPIPKITKNSNWSVLEDTDIFKISDLKIY